MPITRNSDQRSKTLEEFYLEVSQQESYTINGKLMLDLLKMVNNTFQDTQLWGLTSLHRLVIQKENYWGSPWYIIINCAGNEYNFEYLMPEDKSPWSGARVIGVATTLA